MRSRGRASSARWRRGATRSSAPSASRASRRGPERSSWMSSGLGQRAVLPRHAGLRHADPHACHAGGRRRARAGRCRGGRRRLRAHPRPVRPPRRARSGSSTRERRDAVRGSRRTPAGRSWAPTASSSSRPRTTRSRRSTSSAARASRSSSSGSATALRGEIDGRGGDRRVRDDGAVARSYVGEAQASRPRSGAGSGSARSSSVSRASTPTPTIALRFRDRRRAADLRHVVCADDRRERQSRDRGSCSASTADPEDYLAVPVEELERDIYATGFYRQKTKSIRGAMRVLLEEFDGKVPRRLDELLRLPGVARKTANVVAAELGHAQGIVVDTHVRRLSQRLGLTRNDDPVKIERDLQRVVPRGGLGPVPAPPDLARPPRLRSRGSRDARTACSSTSVRRRGSTRPHAAALRPDPALHDEAVPACPLGEKRVAGRRDDRPRRRDRERRIAGDDDEHRVAAADEAQSGRPARSRRRRRARAREGRRRCPAASSSPGRGARPRASSPAASRPRPSRARRRRRRRRPRRREPEAAVRDRDEPDSCARARPPAATT